MSKYFLYYLKFLRRQIPSVLQIATFFCLTMLLLPDNLLKLALIALSILLTYWHLMEEERHYLVEAIKNHATDINLDEMNDGDLAQRWRFYDFGTAVLLGVVIAALSYGLRI